MGSNGPDEIMVAALDEAECSETTVEIKIKTLDSQTYTLRVNKCVPVPELKERIQTVTGVLSDQQRLICRGKVLKDDQLLSAYHVEDGHTLHLVVRQPIPPSSTSATGITGSENLPDHSGGDPATGSGQNGGNHVSHRVLLGSFNIAEHGDGNTSDLNRIISAVLSSIGITSVGSSTEASEPMERGAGRHERTSGSSVTSDSNQPNLEQSTAGAQFDQLHAFRIPSSAALGSLQPPVIPDSLATLLHYLSHLRHEFAAIGGIQGSLNADRPPSTTSHSGVGQVGLPTAASLAHVIQSTRQLLIEQVGEHLSQLARQLEDQINATSPSLRNNIQSSAIRTGILLQNLGALLLELGRTTMTLRMGQTPSDAVVNAGPAVFISTSGPNPIMVQPLQPGVGFGASAMGTINAGSGLLGGTLGSGLFPRNIDIRIRSGPSASSGNVNQGEQAGAQQIPVQTAQERSSNAAGSVHQQGQGVPGGSTFTREAGVRMLPIRTVVASVPASVSRPTSTSSGGSMGLFYPLIARYQPATSRQSNDARGAEPTEHYPSIPETDYHQIPNSIQQQNVTIDASTTNEASHNPILRSLDAVDNDNNTRQSGQARNNQDSARQIFRDQLPTESVNTREGNNVGADTNETPRLGVNDGIYLSRLLHQIIPYVSQNAGPEPTNGPDGVLASEDLSQQTTHAEDVPCVGASHSRDGCPPSPSSSKRQKRE